MNVMVNETQTEDFEQLKTRLKATWSAGDYDTFSRFMEKDAEQFYRRLHISPGTRLLDVGCGAGQLALIAARAGADVTGCDIAPNWIEKGRIRAAAEGLKIRFEEGDAESLPYADSQFDAVVSLIGAMFAPRPERVAAELIRVCRPGGVIAMANWTPGGFIGQMFKAIAKYIAPSGMPSPVLWGDETAVRERLGNGTSDLKCTLRVYHFEYPFSAEEVVAFYRANYGPVARAFAVLDANGQQELRSELVRLWSSHNKSNGTTTSVDAEYLEVVAKRGIMNHRAELLADRILEGAAGLAAFTETLSDAEWSKPVSNTDRRSIGAIVHHVASVYPVEIQLAQAIAGGNAVTDVTWDVVAGLNAKLALEAAGVTKAGILDLLRRNSHAAAEAVRAFTDVELDRAASFSLSYGAPVTAQFVIEDHALRHSWHHLARIRLEVGR